MNNIMVIKDMQNRIVHLDKLAAQRREILDAEYVGRETKAGIVNANITASDRAKIEAEWESICAQSAEIKAKLATLKAATPPEDPVQRKELEKTKAEAGKQFKKLIDALSLANEAGKQYCSTRQHEAALRAILDGVPDYWKNGKQGLITSHILASIGQLFRDIRLVEGK